MVNLTCSLALSLADCHIQGHCLVPGFFIVQPPDTPVGQQRCQQQGRLLAIGRTGEPEEPGTLTVFLASAASDHTTGVDARRTRCGPLCCLQCGAGRTAAVDTVAGGGTGSAWYYDQCRWQRLAAGLSLPASRRRRATTPPAPCSGPLPETARRLGGPHGLSGLRWGGNITGQAMYSEGGVMSHP
jgi:hypothetical protein